MDPTEPPIPDKISNRNRELPDLSLRVFTSHIVHTNMNNMRSKEASKIDLYKIRVYYDGLCRVCDREMSHYRKLSGAENIEFIDICSRSFDAIQEGLDPHEVHRVFHVRKIDGSLVTGLDAFIEIWDQLPRYRWLAAIARKNWSRKILNPCYSLFIKVRPWLPRKTPNLDCSQSPYCEVNKNQ